MKVSVEAPGIPRNIAEDSEDEREASPAGKPNAISLPQTNQAISPQAPHQTVTRVVVSARAFRRWWVFVVAVHCFCGLFLGYVGAFYLYLTDSSVIVDLTNYSMTISASHFPDIANVYFALSSLHGMLVAYIVFRSIQAHQLAFRKSRSLEPTSSSKNGSVKIRSDARRETQDSSSSPTASHSTRISLTSRLQAMVGHIWRILCMIFAAFDVRNEQYGVVFLVRELVLTFLQTYQTYRLSCLVPRVWMNNVMVVLLVLNCWATPLLHYLLRANVGYVRLGGVLVNMVLDMALYIGLPTALLVPYATQINRDIRQFDHIYWYTDIWLIELINEAQIIFVTSPYDAVSKYLIALSVTRGLHAITKLVCKIESIDREPAAVDSTSFGSVSVTPVTPFDDQVLNPIPVSHSHLRLRSRLEKLGYQLLLLWGFVILIVHLHASSLRAHPQCRLPTRPWFRRQPSCALLEINCVVEQASGSVTDIDEILRIFDPTRVEYLVIRHCPLLVMSPRIQTLRVLLGLKVFNSTILDWSDEAAVTNTHHPGLRFLFLVDVRVREFPVGLLSPDFPKALRDIEISRANLTTVPDTLDMVWPKGMFIVFEECQLQEIPPVVLRLQPKDLGLSLNNIATIPAELLESHPIRIFLLDGNPIKSFPSPLAHSPQIVWIDLINTQINDLPDWMDDTFLASTYVIAGNTPLCDRLIAAGEASASEPHALLGIFGLDCSFAFVGNGTLLWYPIDLESTINPSYSQ